MKLYEVQVGYSITTARGVAHCGAKIHKGFFSDPKKAEKDLEEWKKIGKLEFLKEIKEEVKEDKKKEIKVEEDVEEEIEEEEEKNGWGKPKYSGAKRK